MNPHPERSSLSKRLTAKLQEITVPFIGPVYRFIAPKYCSIDDMFAGMGPMHADGRWQLRGQFRATYTSLRPETALAEALAANRYYGFPDTKAAPLVYVAAEAKMKQVIDLRDGKIRQHLRTPLFTMLETDWRKENRAGNEAVTQAWGWALHEAGVEGFLVPSAATSGGENLIVFPDHLKRFSHFRIVNAVEWPR